MRFKTYHLSGLALSILSASLFVTTAVSALEPIGEITSLEIGAYGTLPERGRVALELETEVHQDEFVETMPDGGLTVNFVDGTDFHLGAGSTAVLDRFLFDPSTASSSGMVDLGKGVFRFVSGDMTNDRDLSFTAGSSIIGVRGTDFVLINESETQMQIGTLSGLVDVTPVGGGEAVEIAPGQYATLNLETGEVQVRDAPVRASDLACWLAGQDYVCRIEPSSTAGLAAALGEEPNGGSNGVSAGVAGGRAGLSADDAGFGGSEGGRTSKNRSGGSDGTNPGGQGNDTGTSNPSDK